MTCKKVVDKLHELIIVSSCTQERGAKTSRQKNADVRSSSRRCGRGLERERKLNIETQRHKEKELRNNKHGGKMNRFQQKVSLAYFQFHSTLGNESIMQIHELASSIA